MKNQSVKTNKTMIHTLIILIDIASLLGIAGIVVASYSARKHPSQKEKKQSLWQKRIRQLEELEDKTNKKNKPTKNYESLQKKH